VRRYIDVVAENIDQAIQNALDKVVDEGGDIVYEPKPLNEIATTRPNTGDVDMNNKRLTNLASLPGLTLEEITATPNVATTVQTVGNYITASLALNTAYCGPLFSTMDVKEKIVTNMADAELILPEDPAGADKIKQGVNLGTLNSLAITTVPEDRVNYYASLHQIKEGARATQDKDFVIREQVVREEDKNLEWLEDTVQKSGKYVDEKRLVFVPTPKAPVLGIFTIEGSNPPSLVSESGQAVNVGFMREKCRLKGNDLNLEFTSRVLELPDPTDNFEAVHKKYCDDNSGKQTEGGGNFFSAIFGAIAGGLAGALSSFATQGLATGFGSLASAGASAFGSFLGSGLFQGGMRVGSQANLEGLKADNPIPNEG
jgi:hypothetical protein